MSSVQGLIIQTNHYELILIHEQYLTMTVCFSTRDRCRLCYTLAIRNRQKFYHLFKPIQRTRFIRKSILPYEYHSSKRTVCFQELLARYLHTNLQYDPTQPNSICSNCSKSLLDIEQCAKYLTKTINQLKRKFNKSNRLLASSLTAKFQLKRIGIKYEQLPLLNSDEDEEFDDIDDEDDDDDDDLVANNGNCHNEQSDGDDEDEDEEEEEEDGLIKTSTDSSHRTDLSVYPQSQPPFNLLNGADPQLFQMYMNQILRNSSTTNSNMDAMANTFNNMQRNIMKMFSQNPLPMNHFAPQIPPMSLLTSNTTKQNLTNSRKRKSIPEKRVITNNNGNIEQETSSNHSEYPLELTRKNVTTNGSPMLTDEEPKESMISNDNSSQRRSTTKRARLSSTTQANDLLSLNQSNSFDDNQKQRKLDPRPCAECGKTLFNDKLHLLHCQTHAKNEKQCWICGIQDDDIKKHIINEHGNQKFTNTGFKCQHCDKVFPVFADLETHTKEHSKKKPFECPICHKRFGQQGNLSCHLRIHSGVKPFTCTSCGKAFRHSNSLRRHARTVHSANRSLTSSNVSLLSANPSLLSSTNEYKLDSFDEQNPSDLIIPSDDGSSSTGGPPSPSQIDSD